MKKVFFFPFHPFLYALLPVLMIFNSNFGELRLPMIIQPLYISFVFGYALFLIYGVLFRRNPHSAAFLTTITIFYFCLLTNNILFIELIDPQQSLVTFNRSEYIPELILLIIVVFTTLFLEIKLHKTTKTVTKFLNIFALCIFIVPVLHISYKQAQRSLFPARLLTNIEFKKNNPAPVAPRDIYYIIVDRYAGFPSLKEYYRFDNSQFRKFLTDRNFYIADNSFANYQFTATSIASSLNMIYLDGIIHSENSTKSSILRDNEDLLPVTKIIQNSAIATYLRDKGYKYYHFGTPWSHTKTSPLADMVFTYKKRTLPESEGVLNWLKKYPSNKLGVLLNTRPYRNQALWALSDRWISHGKVLIEQSIGLSTIASAPGPKFVFIHSLLTHDPYVFDTIGNYYIGRTKYNLPVDTDASYIEQLKYANQILMNTIDTILASSSKTPIIILQADEGPYPLKYRSNIKTFDFRTDATKDDLFHKFNILNAYLIPDVSHKRLYSTITPVNSFRFILNTYFNEELPLLPDRVFASKTYFSIKDVTKQLIKK